MQNVVRGAGRAVTYRSNGALLKREVVSTEVRQSRARFLDVAPQSDDATPRPINVVLAHQNVDEEGPDQTGRTGDDDRFIRELLPWQGKRANFVNVGDILWAFEPIHRGHPSPSPMRGRTRGFPAW